MSTADTDTGSQGIRSHNQVDRSPTSDLANGGSRLDEALYGTSGKSSSTKTVFDSLARLSRTNDLTTAKPASEESRSDEKANRTSFVQLGSDTVHRETEASVRSSEGTESKDEFQSKAEVKPAAASESSRSSALKLGTIDLSRESATQKVVLEELQERIKKADSNPTKNSEVPDLEKAEKDAGTEPVSLINDTYVNYSQHPRTSTEKDSEVDSSLPRVSENATNFISEESTVTHVSGDPKGDVEVVDDVTHSGIEKVAEQNSMKGVSSRSQQRLIESTTQKGPDTSTLQSAFSPVPRGRTIAFSGMNEYPNLETKPTMASKTESPRKDTADKVLEQKPYPYQKSPIKGYDSSVGSLEIGVSTEEPSALENTIGRGQPEEKFAVTEASDVLENSIQLKPAYREKSANESSTISSTESRSSIPMTTVSVTEEAKPTSQSSRSNDLKAITGEEKSSSIGNDVPRWGSEGREAIVEKGNFDVTGNGITEVTVKPESSDKRTYEEKIPVREVNRTTAAPEKVPVAEKPQTEAALSKVDVQTSAESSLLLRSTLNATELSTEYPLIKGSFPESSTVPIASPLDKAETASMTIEEISAGNGTETPVTSDTNGTNEIPNLSSTLSPDEPFVPTTTGVEYEFVGLSETTTSPTQNATEDALEAGGSSGTSTIVPSVQDLFTKGVPNEVSTTSVVTVTDNSLISDETEVTNVSDGLTSTLVTDQTIVPTSAPSPTSKDDSVTLSSVVEESSTEDIQRSSTVDAWTTTSDEEVTTGTEQALVSGSKDPRFVNTTEVIEPGLTTKVSTSTAKVVTAFATSTPRPRTSGSSTTVPTVSDVSMEETDATKVSIFSEEIKSWVRIVMEGTSYDVCPKMDKLKLTLAEILMAGMNK